MTEQTNTVAPLKITEKIGYSFGDFASNLFWMIFIYFGMFFYTDVFGITAAAAGTMFLVTKLVDTFFDPIMGIITDRTTTRWGKYRPYLLFIAGPFALLGLAAFTTPDLSMTGKLIWAYVTYTLFMIAYSAINLPYSALMGVLTPSVADRTKISTIRFAAAFMGGIFISSFTMPLVGYFGGDSTEIVTIASDSDHKIVLEEKSHGAVQIKIKFDAHRADETGKPGWLKAIDDATQDKDHMELTTNVWVNTPERLAEIRVPKAADQLSALEIADNTFQDGNFYLTTGFGKKEIDLKAVFDKEAWEKDEKSINWAGAYNVKVINQQSGFMRSVGLFAAMALLLFLLTFLSTKERVAPDIDQNTDIKNDIKNVIKSRAWWIISIMSLFTLAQVCIRGGAIMYYFKYYVGNTDFAGPFMVVGTITNLLGTLMTPWLTKLAGSKKRLYIITVTLQVPLLGFFFFLNKDQIFAMFLITTLGGILSGPMSPIVWAMYADIADHSEWRDGTRATGLFFSAASFAQKMGWTIGGAVAAWLLAWYGFEANIEQTAETIQGIKTLMSWIPAAGCLISAILMFFYPLDEKLMAIVEKELEKRRSDKSAHAAEASAQ